MAQFALDEDGTAFPTKARVGSLSGELAEEAKYKVSEGVKPTWFAPPKQQMFPDLSKIDKIAKYFNRQGFEPWPSWIYHPTEQPRKVEDAAEALEYGIIYREPTEDEALMGHGARYDFIRGTPWRTKPYKGTMGFDYQNPGAGKNYEAPRPDYLRTQSDTLKSLVAAMQEGNKNQSGGGITAAELAQALVMAMKMMREEGESPRAAAPAGPIIPIDDQGAAEVFKHTSQVGPIVTLAEAEAQAVAEKAAWVKEAETLGIKIDKRWGLDRIKAAVEAAQDAGPTEPGPDETE